MTDKPTLVRIVSGWDSSGLMRQTPGGARMWGGICFTTRSVGAAYHRQWDASILGLALN